MKFDPTRDNLFSMRDDSAHTKLRAKMAAGVSLPHLVCDHVLNASQYSGKENESMEGTIDAQIKNFIELIETKYLSTLETYHPMDLGEKTSFFTLDVISDLAFGQAFGYLERDDDVYGYLAMSKTALPVMMAISDVPAIADILQSRLFRALLPSEADKAGFGAFIG